MSLFYQRESIGQQFHYICSILKKDDEKHLHFVKYSDIEKLVIRCTKRYTKIVMTNLYTDMYLASFAFYFKDLPTLYITSAMILENDSQLLGYLLKEKVSVIVDLDHVLDEYCQGNNLTESMTKR